MNEFVIYCKKLEKILNKRFKRLTNRQQFVVLVEKLLDQHIKQVQYQRNLVNKWLDSKGYANKEEISNVAKKYISNESKLDNLEDLIHNISKNLNSNKQVLKSFKQELNELNS